MAAIDEVRKASDQFYSALSRMAVGETDTMKSLWSHDDSITTMHPIGGREKGWDAVNGSFNGVAQAATGGKGKVELKDQLIRVLGDVAYEVGNEEGELHLGGKQIKIDQRVTNIYHKEDGSWKLIHHHADISPAMVELISSMQPGS